jgi:DNA-binding NarL/FixJ family response regulator
LITVALCDDDAIILSGLSMIISACEDFEIVGTAQNGFEAVELCRKQKPQVIMLDIRMPKMDGIEAAKIILEEKLSLPLFLTTFDEPKLLNDALEMGAYGYILKNSPSKRIIAAIATVASGGTVFAPDIVKYMRTVSGAPKLEAKIFDELTKREKEIVSLIAQGLSNAEIAQQLFISNGTVRNHISTVLEKLNLEHRTQIAVRYLAL